MQYDGIDKLLINVDIGLRTLWGVPQGTGRQTPSAEMQETELSAEQKRLSAALMRINHAGEIAAQALYQSQALTARDKTVRDKMQRAAIEENDHLIWCEQRLQQLGSHTSYLGGFWYVGSFSIGTLAGLAGDKWNLGFVAETEKQVISHLEKHLKNLPEQDVKSQAIIEQMKEDEARHQQMAINNGAAKLPFPVRFMMKQTAKVMTGLAFYL
jgi:ubiquinone biosynthesis monooxygenase Coq7